MARSFYTDEEETYTTPGLPTIAEPAHSAYKKHEESINRFGNVINTSPGLQSLVGKLRETAIDYYTTLEEKAEFYTDIGKSHLDMTTDKIASFKDANENLLPHSCTVLTSTLVGSIISRNHSLHIRFLTPLIFGSVALKYTMPNTFANIANGLSSVGNKLEDKYVPELKQYRVNSLESVESSVNKIDDLKHQSWTSLVSFVSETRKFISSNLESIKKD